jgi:hypothetical protein
VIDLAESKQIDSFEDRFIPEYDFNPHNTSYADECLHLPNDIDFETEIHTGEEIIRQYNCNQCGKLIQNIYTYTKTREKNIKH